MNYYICYKGKLIFDAKNDWILAESKLQKLSASFTNLELLTLQLPSNEEAVSAAAKQPNVFAFPVQDKPASTLSRLVR